MHILITNDDGVFAKGLQVLVETLRSFAEITVVAPDQTRSGASSQITTQVPVRLSLEKQEEGLTVYKCSGTPVDCVKLALHVLFADSSPDMLISGINHGRNDGICVVYSGTIAAAMEGAISGIPSIALSTESFRNGSFEAEKKFIPQLFQWLQKNPLDHSTFLNINFPEKQPLGVRLAPETIGRFVDEFKKSEDAFGNPVYWMQGNQTDPYNQIDSDYHCIEDQYISITPLKLDQTDYNFLSKNQNLAQDVLGWEL